MTPICMTDVAQHLADYIDLVVTRGERFTLLREGKPVAELGPVLTVVRGEDLPAVLTTLARLTAEEAGTLFREQGPLLTPVTSGPLAGR
jgi:antitoxin (DNA-binding transcriptional repressor) of toxin-antitoxin stability system